MMQAKLRESEPHLPICDDRPHPDRRERRSSKHHVSMQTNIQMSRADDKGLCGLNRSSNE